MRHFPKIGHTKTDRHSQFATRHSTGDPKRGAHRGVLRKKQKRVHGRLS